MTYFKRSTELFPFEAIVLYDRYFYSNIQYNWLW